MGAPLHNRNAVGNRCGKGHPPKYRPEYASPEVTSLCLLGADNKRLADHFGVHESQISRWIKRHIEFAQAVNDGRLIADGKVVASLYRRACGYTFRRPKGELVHVPSDTTAAIFWLCNRNRDLWKRGDSGHRAVEQAEKRDRLRELWSALQPAPEEPLSAPERKPS